MLKFIKTITTMTLTEATYIPPVETGQLISGHSKHVFIHDDSTEKLGKRIANSFLKQESTLKTWKKHKLHPQVPNEDAVDFIFVMDTLNFSFWPDDPSSKFTINYKGTAYTGFWSLVAVLRRAIDEGKQVCSAQYMSTISKEEFKQLFWSDSEATVPLLEERYKAYCEAGRVLLDHFNGSFANCVRACEKDAVKLVQMIVTNFSSYRDISEFEGAKVAFLKRAQIVVADVWCCFEGKGLGEFTNINKLTMFADYRVPQALEYFGILRYSSELKSVLEKGTILKNGSRFELEIRGCSIEAVERLKAAARSAVMKLAVEEGKDYTDVLNIINSITVDHYLWDYAKAHREELAQLPIHKVRTIFY